jgi:hypothetical protein
MPFALDNNPSTSEISEAINYLISNLSQSVSTDQNTGQVISPDGGVYSYLYRYLYIRYSDSIDGSSNFSTSPTDRQYYGIRNTDSGVPSSNPQDYVWTKISGGFSTDKFLYYQVNGGRQAQIFIGYSWPGTPWVLDSGYAVDLDIQTSSIFSDGSNYVDLANGSAAGYFSNSSGSQVTQVSNTAYAVQPYDGAIGAFTGDYDGLILMTDPQPDIGDILVDTSLYASKTVYDAICVNNVSTTDNQPNVVGVFAGYAISEIHVPSALAIVTVDSLSGAQYVTLDPAYTDIFDYYMVKINGCGQGLINVCGENGNISAGDLICTSNTAGKGMKQSTNDVKNVTVAKSREDVTFASPSEVKQIACIYMVG